MTIKMEVDYDDNYLSTQTLCAVNKLKLINTSIYIVAHVLSFS